MLSLVSALHRTSRVFVWIGGILILGSAFLVTVEVVLRKVANYSIGGADELSGYAFRRRHLTWLCLCAVRTGAYSGSTPCW